jgi:hypothetical protein
MRVSGDVRDGLGDRGEGSLRTTLTCYLTHPHRTHGPGQLLDVGTHYRLGAGWDPDRTSS